MNANAHGLRNPLGKSNGFVGFGLFPLVAMLNHDCSPNCVYHFKFFFMILQHSSPIFNISLFQSKWRDGGQKCGSFGTSNRAYSYLHRFDGTSLCSEEGDPSFFSFLNLSIYQLIAINQPTGEKTLLMSVLEMPTRYQRVSS